MTFGSNEYVYVKIENNFLLTDPQQLIYNEIFNVYFFIIENRFSEISKCEGSNYNDNEGELKNFSSILFFSN